MSAGITVRLPAEIVEHLDAMARQRGGTRTGMILAAIEDAIARDSEQRAATLKEAQVRLSAPLQAQADFLAEVSVADEWRSF